MNSILYITNGAGLASQMAGSLKRIVEIAPRLMKKGWEVHFLTTKGTEAICESLKLPINIHILPASIFKQKETCLFDRAWSYLLSTLASFWVIPSLPRFDIIFSDTDYFCDVIPALYYHKIKKVPWVGIIHHRIGTKGDNLIQRLINLLSAGLQQLSHRLIGKFASGVFLYQTGEGEEIAHCFISKGVPSEKIYFVKNGIDLSLISSVRNPQKIYQACFVGGLRPSKGIFDLIEIWKRVIDAVPPARLVIVGGGTRLADLHDRIEEEELQDNIISTGFLRNREVLYKMKQSHLFIFPSYEEGWGIVIAEAMACGLPVVAYNLTAYRNVFDSVLCSVRIGDKDRFSWMIVQLLQNQHMREELGEKGIKHAAAFDWDRIASEEEKIFKHIISGSGTH